MRLFVLAVLLLSSAFGADLAVQTAVPAGSDDTLYRGWLRMYDLKFDEAHQLFQTWMQNHPADSLGPASNAAAYLFSELARLGALESELFTDNKAFMNRGKLQPDPQVKAQFDKEVAAADRAADSALRNNGSDTNALFAKSMSLGLRADSASLLDRHDLTALKFMKDSRAYEEKVIMINPKVYDAYLGSGVENYLLSLKTAPVRFFLRITGSLVDREQGIRQAKLTAEHGHYLEPFAKLLLAVAALRDNDRNRARALLSELHNRFPDNRLYVRELNRLN